ncbi:MAG: flagellar biosynthesis protein FlgJ [Nitratiruptor sp.]|nr:flagellar biosynthesis protein FlgJ [Nitratiruptor sp.]NPA84257.1 flagellar biosynthesis protein FlgJ [Campylobacterota bacterium]
MKIEAPYWDLHQLSRTTSAKGAARAFEAELVHLFLKEVRKELAQSPLFGATLANRLYFDLFDMELANQIAQSGQLQLGVRIEEAMKAYRQGSDG